MTRRIQRACVAGAIIGLFFLAWPTGAKAQFVEFERTLWGVSASMSSGFLPKWETPQSLKAFYLADEIALKGSEFQIGVVRGTTTGGDSGWSFFRQPIERGSFVVDSESDGSSVRLAVDSSDTTFDGFLYHRYTPFTMIRERVQIGMVIAGGAGWYRGMVTETRTDAEGGSTDSRMAANVLSGLVRQSESRWMPLPVFRFEAAVAGVLPGGFKARFSGGYGLPNGRTLRLGFVYLIGS